MECIVVVVVFVCLATAFASAAEQFYSSGADMAVWRALDRIDGDASIMPEYEL